MLPYPAAGVAAAAAIVVYVLYSVEHEPDHHVDELEWVIDGAMDAGAASVLGGEPLRFRLPNAGRAMALWAKASMVRRQRTLPNVCASRERFITYCDRELVGGCGHRLVASLPAEEILDGSCGDPDGRTHCSFSGDPQLFERTMHQALLGLEPALGAAGLELGTARRNVWVGGSNVTTTLHYDGVHNLFVQLHGSKRFLLLPPVAWLYVYPTPYSLSRQRQSAIPGELLDHCLRTGSPPPGHDKTAMARDLPLLAMWCGLNRTEVQPMLRPLSVVLRAGDVLYLPVRAWATASGAPRVSHAASQPFWYHHVISLSSSVSASWWVQATEVEAARCAPRSRRALCDLATCRPLLTPFPPAKSRKCPSRSRPLGVPGRSSLPGSPSHPPFSTSSALRGRRPPLPWRRTRCATVRCPGVRP